jgi:glycosyltransferase involved in cell wall biosynthesis
MEKKLNICLISREFPPDTAFGGMGIFSANLAVMLREHGHDVTVFSQSLNKDYIQQYRDIPVFRYRIENVFLPVWIGNLSRFIIFFNYRLYSKILSFHKQKKFDIIDVPDHLAEGLFASLHARIPTLTRIHTPFSLLVHLKLNNYDKNITYLFIKLYEQLALRHSTALYCPTYNLANLCKNFFGIKNQISLFGYPIDVNKYSPSIDYKVNPKAIKILFLGRLEHRKGIHTIAEAFPEVARNDSSTRLTIIGSDTPNISGYPSGKTFLEDRFKKNSCLDRVEFLPPVPYDSLADVFNSYDILWVPSLYDNYPLTCIEAMACGKAVIASDAGGTPEIFRSDGCGIVFPVGDYMSLAAHTINLVRNPDKIIEMGKLARRLIVEEFSYEIIYKKTIELYESVIGSFRY